MSMRTCTGTCARTHTRLSRIKYCNNWGATKCLKLFQDAFATAGERDIYTGDHVDILIITKDGVKHEQMQLRYD